MTLTRRGHSSRSIITRQFRIKQVAAAPLQHHTRTRGNPFPFQREQYACQIEVTKEFRRSSFSISFGSLVQTGINRGSVKPALIGHLRTFYKWTRQI